MMEFTYHGMVRWGFGFYNPNHAAACIVLLLPMFWFLRSIIKRKFFKALVFLFEAPLYIGLLLTYSRTGFITFLLCLIIWEFLNRQKRSDDSFSKYNFKAAILSSKTVLISGIIVFVLGSAAVIGTLPRLFSWIVNPDKSVLNRFGVLAGSTQIFANNPMGIGEGLSGQVYDLFFNKISNVSYRTLINSFLTFMVERGIFWSFLVLFIFTFAAIKNTRTYRNGKRDGLLFQQRFSAMILIMLLSGFISAMGSTCFDFEILLNPSRSFYGVMNDRMQRWFLIFFIAIIIIGLFYKPRFLFTPKCVKSILISLGISFCILAFCYITGLILNSIQDRPSLFIYREVDNSTWVKVESKRDNADLVIFPENMQNLKSLKKFVKKYYTNRNYNLPLTMPSQIGEIIKNTSSNKQMLLCGQNSYYVPQCRQQQANLFKPKFLIDETDWPKLRSIYLSRWDESGENYAWQTMADSSNINLIFVEDF